MGRRGNRGGGWGMGGRGGVRGRGAEKGKDVGEERRRENERSGWEVKREGLRGREKRRGGEGLVKEGVGYRIA